jgi:hypothetical protein
MRILVLAIALIGHRVGAETREIIVSVGAAIDQPLDRSSWLSSVGPSTIVELGGRFQWKDNGPWMLLALHWARQNTTFLEDGMSPAPAARTDLGFTIGAMTGGQRFNVGAVVINGLQIASSPKSKIVGSSRSQFWQFGPIALDSWLRVGAHVFATASASL